MSWFAKTLKRKPSEQEEKSKEETDLQKSKGKKKSDKGEKSSPPSEEGTAQEKKISPESVQKNKPKKEAENKGVQDRTLRKATEVTFREETSTSTSGTPYILWFDDISMEDIHLVGGKGASLGEMYHALKSLDIAVPPGFCVTTTAYKTFLAKAGIQHKIKEMLKYLGNDQKKIKKVSKDIRQIILGADLPEEIEQQIVGAYRELKNKVAETDPDLLVAVRSSATAEDLPEASFAGQYDSFLNIRNESELLNATKDCIASLFNETAIFYRLEHNFDKEVFISLVVQQMVKSHLTDTRGCSGVIFTADSEFQSRDLMVIQTSWGSGETVVKGRVIPDHIKVYKTLLKQEMKERERYKDLSKNDEVNEVQETQEVQEKQKDKTEGKKKEKQKEKLKDEEEEKETKEEKETEENFIIPIIEKAMGDKEVMLTLYRQKEIKEVATPTKMRNQFCLEDKETLQLARWALEIENYFSEKYGKYTPQDIEFAKDGKTSQLYIVQARPLGSFKDEVPGKHIVSTNTTPEDELKEKEIVTGAGIGRKIVSGPAKVLKNIRDYKGDKNFILVTAMTDPDWEVVFKNSIGIVTDRGGRTCHAAIVSREMGLPCVVGTSNGTEKIKDGQIITIDCSTGDLGVVYDGKINWKDEEINSQNFPDLSGSPQIMVNISRPALAWQTAKMPNHGVGLVRLEFIFTNYIKVHPMALLEFDRMKKASTKERFLMTLKNSKLSRREYDEIYKLVARYESGEKYFVDKLSFGLAHIAAAFYPKPVIVRFSDLKTNEYSKLLGGSSFECKESNPMLGFRGAVRYYSDKYKDAFKLECQAISIVRNKMGLTNVSVMIPMIRTVKECEIVVNLIRENGLPDSLIYGMCEVPSNVILADKFLKILDGYSIGTNDLTQLILGADRDSADVTSLLDERNEAVVVAIEKVIDVCNKMGKYCGTCGEAVSNYPELLKFVIDCGITSVSLDSDALIDSWVRVAKWKGLHVDKVVDPVKLDKEESASVDSDKKDKKVDKRDRDFEKKEKKDKSRKKKDKDQDKDKKKGRSPSPGKSGNDVIGAVESKSQGTSSPEKKESKKKDRGWEKVGEDIEKGSKGEVRVQRRSSAH